MALSTQERQLVSGIKNKGGSKDEALQALSDFRNRGVVRETFDDVKEGIGSVLGEFKTAGEKIVDVTQDPSLKGKPLTALRTAGAEAFRGGARAIGEGIVAAGKTVLPQRAEEAIGEKVTQIGQRIGETKTVQNLVQKYNSLPSDSKREVDNALGFAEGLGEIITLGAIKKLSAPVIDSAIKVVDTAASKTKRVNDLVKNTTSDTVKKFQNKLQPSDRATAVDSLKQSYEQSFVSDKAGVSNALEKEAARQGTRANPVDKDILLRNLAEEGALPVVEGKLGNFRPFMEEISARQGRLAESLDPLLTSAPQKTKISDLIKSAEQTLRRSPQIGVEFKRALNELKSAEKSLTAKYGDTISVLSVNEIRKQMNSITRAFGTDVFKQDAADAIADATRSRLDEVFPDGMVRQTNAEIGRLTGIKNTAKILNNKPIDVGIVGEQLGRYLGVLGGSSLGVLAGGTGGLVIAGILAYWGGNALAAFLRKARFNQPTMQSIIREISKDGDLVKKLVDEADSQNKEFLNRILLPAPGETAIPLKAPAIESGVKAVPAEKGPVGVNPKTGKFKKTFKSQ